MGAESALTFYALGLTVTSPAGSAWAVAPHLQGGLPGAQGGFSTPLGWFGVQWALAGSGGLRVEIEPQILSRTDPARITYTADTTDGSGRVFTRNPGRAGYRVVTYRVFSRNGRVVRRERLSDDTYPTMDRILQVGQDN